MKKNIAVSTAWLIGAVIWILMAQTSCWEGRNGTACIQLLAAILGLIHAVRGYTTILRKRWHKP